MKRIKTIYNMSDKRLISLVEKCQHVYLSYWTAPKKYLTAPDHLQYRSAVENLQHAAPILAERLKAKLQSQPRATPEREPTP